MASASGTVPDVSPSQVLTVSPSLPTNKLLDNLTVKHLIFVYFLSRNSHFRKIKDFYNHYPKIMKKNNISPLFIKLY
jgi:hypothetical protein